MSSISEGRRIAVGALAVAAILALGLATAPAGAHDTDRSQLWAGTLLGGTVGGLIGSEIGKGRGRLIAIGAGSLLGGLYGGHLARRHLSHRAHHHRVHHRPWRAPRAYREVHVHHHPAPPPAPAREPAAASDYLLAGAPVPAPQERRPMMSECRTLEAGLSPVYACRTAGGEWRILR